VSRKRSIPDIVTAGRSRIVPYRRGEDFRTRHTRRLRANLEQEANLRHSSEQRGLTLRTTMKDIIGKSRREFSGRMVAIECKARDWEMRARRNSLS